MGKINQYKQLLESVLNEQPELLHNLNEKDIETHMIYDQARQRYLVYRVGWHHKKRVSSVLIYVHIKNDKIWIEEDWTEEGITPALLAAGVPKEDIVLAFRHPQLRPLTEFAVS
jgi:hypothetical protein